MSCPGALKRWSLFHFSHKSFNQNPGKSDHLQKVNKMNTLQLEQFYFWVLKINK